MQYARCECGKCECWHTGEAPITCMPCNTCGTVPAESPNTHPDPTPHDFSLIELVDTDEGQKTLTRCRICHNTLRQIEKN